MNEQAREKILSRTPLQQAVHHAMQAEKLVANGRADPHIRMAAVWASIHEAAAVSMDRDEWCRIRDLQAKEN